MGAEKRTENLHDRLIRCLREEVRAADGPGSRLPPDRELAARFGVSNITIRDAMLVLAADGWVDRRRGSGTYVADRASRQHVGVLNVTDLLHDDLSLLSRQSMRLLREELEALGHPVRVYSGRDTPWGTHDHVDCPAFDKAVAGESLSGLIAVGTEPEERWVKPLRTAGVPVVFAGDYRDRVPYCVIPDHRQLGYDAVRALLQGGRRRIGLLQWVHPRPGGIPTPDLMWDGVCAALAEAELAPNEAWVRKDLHPSWHGAGWSEFREIWAASPTKPDGLIIGDDVLFDDAVEAIVQLGIRVPEQLLVVAQTNALAVPRLPFPVITMEFDPQLIAARAATMLDALMRGSEPDSPTRLVPFRQRWCAFPDPVTTAQMEDRL